MSALGCGAVVVGRVMPRMCELFVISRAGLLPFGVCGLPLVLVESDEVEGVPVVVGFMSEGSFCEESRLALAFALHVNYGDTKDVTAS